MADLNIWLKWSIIITYADDTSTSVSGKLLKDIIIKLEEDALLVLKFMASNKLVANPTKTSLLFMNLKGELDIKINIGEAEIKREKSAKLLGMNMTDDQQWNKHINLTISALNKRFFLICRMRNKINNRSLRTLSNSIFNSKLRYGIQLCGKVRLLDIDSTQGPLEELQKVQNKMFRLLNNTRIKDKISTKSIMANLNMLSVNQVNAQIKLTEIWKSLKVDDYPIHCQKLKYNPEARSTRASERGDLISDAASSKSQATFLNDAFKIWNAAPIEIKNSNTLAMAKKVIRNFVTTLPI